MSELTDMLRDTTWQNSKHPLDVAGQEVWHARCCEAADKIAALTAERDGLREACKALAEHAYKREEDLVRLQGEPALSDNQFAACDVKLREIRAVISLVTKWPTSVSAAVSES